jgi:Fe2+ or Zn2+ uptake regulation protein
MGFLNDLLTKISCHHDWKVHNEVSVYESDRSKRPYKIVQTLICNKCGKIKQIEL